MKKITTVLLAVMLMALSLAVTPAASAAELKGDQLFGYITEYKSFYDQYSAAIDQAAKDVYDLKTNINIVDYRIPASEASKFYTVLIHTHPELFYVGSGFGYSYVPAGTPYLYSLTLHWGQNQYDEYGNVTGETTFTDEQVVTMRNEFRTRAQWYLDKVDDTMSDFEKALILHDELALNASYLLSGETYDLMVNGVGKCYGYSEAYAYLLAQVGVNSEIVESEDMFHQWNKVEINGVYYHVDVTWDDPTPDRLGYVRHTFFLLSDNEIESLENPHYNYDSEFASNDTRYDKMAYHNINTRLCYVGEDCYVVDNNSASTSQTSKNLLIYNLADDSFASVHSFANEYWFTNNGRSVWSGAYMSLDGKDGYLYMNTQNTVYVYDTQTGELTALAENTFDKSFYGLRVIDGKVYAVLADTPNETGTLQYVADCLEREEQPAVILGDLDGDGTLDIADVTSLQRYIAEMGEMTQDQALTADANQDGRINIMDVTKMQRVIAELETF